MRINYKEKSNSIFFSGEIYKKKRSNTNFKNFTILIELHTGHYRFKIDMQGIV